MNRKIRIFLLILLGFYFINLIGIYLLEQKGYVFNSLFIIGVSWHYIVFSLFALVILISYFVGKKTNINNNYWIILFFLMFALNLYSAINESVSTVTYEEANHTIYVTTGNFGFNGFDVVWEKENFFVSRRLNYYITGYNHDVEYLMTENSFIVKDNGETVDIFELD